MYTTRVGMSPPKLRNFVSSIFDVEHLKTHFINNLYNIAYIAYHSTTGDKAVL